ncbi:MAG: DivIVA domain-containing protein [Candidatus Nanopelagicales bacterium]
MALTPKDVHEKQFSTVKMRTGYDMDEVDQFLDDVEASLGQMQSENDALKAQIVKGGGTPAAASAPAVADAEKKIAEAEAKVADLQKKLDDAVAAKGAADAKVATLESQVKELQSKPAAAPAAAAAALATPAAPATSQDVPAKAFAMLEAAQRTADETVSSAKSEAATILAGAREEAKKVTGALDEQRAALEVKVNELRTFERSYRVKLRDTIAGQLKEFDSIGSAEPKAPVT